MKQIKKAKQFILLTGCFLLLVFVITSSFVWQASSPASQDAIAQAINNDRWDFAADYAYPSYGKSRNITGSYYVQCRKDTLIVALPYYGKLNSPAGASNENPLDFKSTNFKLTKEVRKKGGWLVTIKSPNSEVQSMSFTFFDNGSAQANFTMTNRSGINFSGKIAAVK
ncbi:MAG TPA: DUF4251 domain-containing protein [Chitinophagaceae bacterium]|jgi:hypothetical protein|nr:DUF4251 domain-containing protein [Chitinophagaceae bacterium]